MTYTYSSVACYEVADSSWENGDVFNGLSAGVRLMCAWGDRYALINDLLGTPQGYPKVSGLGGMTPYAVSARASARGGETPIQNGQGMDYENAYVDVQYNTTVVDVASEVVEPNMELIPQNPGWFNWGGTSAPVMVLDQEAPPLVYQSFALVRTRFRLSVIPTDVLAAIGCVNLYSYTSTILGLTFAPGTLLFTPAPLTRSFTNFTSTGFTLTLKFAYKPNGWNKFFRSATNQFESQYLNGSNTPYASFPSYDFTTLLS